MKIGIPKEMANSEFRVGMTHEGVKCLVNMGHEIYVSSGAGKHSGITDDMYRKAGAEILESVEAIYSASEFIVKVKPPIQSEFQWIKQKQIIFSYVLPERHKELTEFFIKNQNTAIGYEGVCDSQGMKPLLIPMSEIAGKMAVLTGGRFLDASSGGQGLMLGGMLGLPAVEVVILGAGNAAYGAAKVALGLGCHVTILNRGLSRLRDLETRLKDKANYLHMTEDRLMLSLEKADMLINTIDQMGIKDKHIISADMIRHMKKGSVIVDVACDKQGTIETIVPTSHTEPIYIVDDVIHCAIPNLPGIVPKTSTMALTETTLPYIIKLANQGVKNAVLNDAGLRQGLCFYEGSLLHKKAAQNFGLEYVQFGNCFEDKRM